MKTLLFTSYLFIISSISFGQFHTEEFTSSGTGDLIMNLGKYKIGTAITVRAQGNGGWAEDGGIYHIASDWNGLPKVIYRGESSISEKLLFFGYVENKSYVYLFAKWINTSPNKGEFDTVRLVIRSINGQFDKILQGNFNNATQLSNVLTVKSNTGSVGIGTTKTGNHKLAVEGSIGAREIKVEANDWSDFVFKEDYRLPTLTEVENHIKEKGHLKDIPSAEDVKKNGIYLGKMNSKLLQKIEELTIYTIQQQKEIESLKKEKEEFKSVSKRLSNLEKLLINKADYKNE